MSRTPSAAVSSQYHWDPWNMGIPLARWCTSRPFHNLLAFAVRAVQGTISGLWGTGGISTGHRSPQCKAVYQKCTGPVDDTNLYFGLHTSADTYRRPCLIPTDNPLAPGLGLCNSLVHWVWCTGKHRQQVLPTRNLTQQRPTSKLKIKQLQNKTELCVVIWTLLLQGLHH